MDRFRVIMVLDARKQGLPGLGEWEEDYSCALYDFSVDPPIMISTDKMEPEDVTFYRDLAWVPKLLNEVDQEKKNV